MSLSGPLLSFSLREERGPMTTFWKAALRALRSSSSPSRAAPSFCTPPPLPLLSIWKWPKPFSFWKRECRNLDNLSRQGAAWSPPSYLPSWIFGDAHHSLFLETASFLGSHHTLLAVSAHPWLFLLKPAPHASFSSPTYMLAFLKGSFLAPSLLPLHVPAGDLLARVASVTLWTL